MLSFRDEGKVFRVKTDYEMLRPVGLFFNCDPAMGFFVDNLKDFRMLSLKKPENYRPTKETLFRQVFDGPIALADGNGKNASHQDQRNLLIADSSLKPIHRTLGAPFSCGLGRKIFLRPSESDFSSGELEIFPGRSWYQIPNSSWYQSWKKYPDNTGTGYLVFYDEWQKARAEVRETLWRGQFPAFAAMRPVHEIGSKRLLRAIVDGSLEAVKEYPESFIASKVEEKFTWAFNPGFSPNKGQLVVYSWEDKSAGRISYFNHDRQPAVLIESKDPEKRFVGFANRGLLVIGSDVVKNWISAKAGAGKKIEPDCDLVAFYANQSQNVTEIAVCSKSRKQLFFFTYDENAGQVTEKLRQVELKFQPEALLYDIAGNLLISAMEPGKEVFFADVEPGYSVETMMFENTEELAEFDEEQGRYVNHQIPDQISGRIVFSQGFRQSLYALETTSLAINFVQDVKLGKKYFCRDFSLNKPPLDLLNLDYKQVVELSREPGNHLSELKEDVPGYPDQFQKPEQVFIGFYQD